MFSKLLSVFCIIVFALQVSVNTIVYVHFKIKQTEISNNLCVQRNTIDNTCKGKCVLKTQLNKSCNKSTAAFLYVKDKMELFYHINYFDFLVMPFIEKKVYVSQDELKVRICSFDIFHPPA